MKKTVLILAALLVTVSLSACGIEDEKALGDKQEESWTEVVGEVIPEVLPEDKPMEIEIEVGELGTIEESYLTKELQRVADAASIMNDSITNGMLSQQELNRTTEKLYKLWDDELNDLWKRLKAKLPDSDMKKLLAEQRTWIADKEKKVAAAGKDFQGGSMQPMIENMEAANLTRERVVELATVLGDAEGVTVFPPVFESEAVDVPGTVTYVDRQGTKDVYSCLDLTDNGDGTFKIDVSIFRLYDFEDGEGVKNGDGIDVTFKVDEDTTFRGTVTFEGEGVVFTAGDDFYSLISAGEKFTFDEKM